MKTLKEILETPIDLGGGIDEFAIIRLQSAVDYAFYVSEKSARETGDKAAMIKLRAQNTKLQNVLKQLIYLSQEQAEAIHENA